VESRTLRVSLPENVAERLRELARREMREPQAQAAYLIIAGLRSAGLDPEPAQPRSRADAAR
jgi:hypothetical protein